MGVPLKESAGKVLTRVSLFPLTANLRSQSGPISNVHNKLLFSKFALCFLLFWNLVKAFQEPLLPDSIHTVKIWQKVKESHFHKTVIIFGTISLLPVLEISLENQPSHWNMLLILENFPAQAHF